VVFFVLPLFGLYEPEDYYVNKVLKMGVTRVLGVLKINPGFVHFRGTW
jgi:hypothetical protein